ncbi:hypothetical protein M5K25_022132 [Dendrobium thyrsiflorum]|uniref:Uncharacterized protein n=1 Tax=Dendrobium thyrsiflorum TaxID=117978 RepID=A0ABD0UBH8_DENTH
MSSFTLQQRVQITKEDLGTYLHLRTEGVRAHNMSLESEYNWTTINRVLRGIDQVCHLPCVYTLYQNAWIIQHVLRSFIIPKAGNRINMTPLLSTVTYIIMTSTHFDEAQLILDYIQNLTDIRHPSTKRKKNIALGHLACYVLEKKYNLVHPDPPTEEPIFSQMPLLGHYLIRDIDLTQEEKGNLDKKLHLHLPLLRNRMPIRSCFSETHFDQRFDQLENKLNTQNDQYNADMAWMRGQTDYINTNLATINSYFTGFTPQPPPDQDSEF